MKLWIDDVRMEPSGYERCRTVWTAMTKCEEAYNEEKHLLEIDEINIDHDAGDLSAFGGDYIKLLEWLEFKEFSDGWQIPTKFHVHSMNPVGKLNMERIIRKNGWSLF